MSRVFVTRPIPDNGLDELRAALGAEAVDVFPHDRPITRDELLEGAAGASALLPMLTDPVDAEVMDRAGGGLKVIANYAVGFNNIDVDAATERRIMVANTPGVLTEATADLTWTLIMAAARRAGEAERYLRAGEWDGWGPQQFLGVDVNGQTLGVFGMGRIGQAVARRAQGFNMRVIYTTRTPLDAETERAIGAEAVGFETLLAESDILSVHCPLTNETRGLFGREAFQAMKPTALFINTSRGQAVDEAALAEALHEGAIFGAGLDVFENEPAIHPRLLECPHAVLLPHLGSATHATRAKMASIAAGNIIAALQGRRPRHWVNQDAWPA